MKGLILLNAYFANRDYLYSADRLKEEFEKRNVAVDVVRNDNFSVFIENGLVRSAVSGYGFVVYLDKDKYVSEMLEKSGVRLFNSSEAISDCDDKMTTYIRLSGLGIPMPKTLAGLMCYNRDEIIKEQSLRRIEQELCYPMVVKNSFGSQGKGVYLVSDREQLISVLEKVKTTPHLIQQYIGESFGKDVRIIVVGDKVLGGMMRESDGDFRSNIGNGGHGRAFAPSEEIEELAIKIKNALGLDFCGIDVLLGQNGPIICEVNSNAFFHAFEKVTAINVAGEYVDHIIRQIYAESAATNKA